MDREEVITLVTETVKRTLAASLATEIESIIKSILTREGDASLRIDKPEMAAAAIDGSRGNVYHIERWSPWSQVKLRLCIRHHPYINPRRWCQEKLCTQLFRYRVIEYCRRAQATAVDVFVHLAGHRQPEDYPCESC